MYILPVLTYWSHFYQWPICLFSFLVSPIFFLGCSWMARQTVDTTVVVGWGAFSPDNSAVVWFFSFLFVVLYISTCTWLACINIFLFQVPSPMFFPLVHCSVSLSVCQFVGSIVLSSVGWLAVGRGLGRGAYCVTVHCMPHVRNSYFLCFAHFSWKPSPINTPHSLSLSMTKWIRLQPSFLRAGVVYPIKKTRRWRGTACFVKCVVYACAFVGTDGRRMGWWRIGGRGWTCEHACACWTRTAKGKWESESDRERERESNGVGKMGAELVFCLQDLRKRWTPSSDPFLSCTPLTSSR